MVFGYTSSEDYCPGLFGLHANLRDFLMVLDDVKVEVIFVGVGEEDVSDSAVSDSRAEDWNVVLIAPIVDALLIVNLLAEPMNEFAGCPANVIFLLLFGHLGIKR